MNKELREYADKIILPILEKIEYPKSVKIFIDDLRECPEGWMLFRDGESFLTWRIMYPDVAIDVISFDHDLGEMYHSGYEIVKYMVDMEQVNTDNIRKIMFHTDNLIGLKNMYFYLINAQKHRQISKDIIIESQKRNCIDGKFSFSPYKVADING